MKINLYKIISPYLLCILWLPSHAQKQIIDSTKVYRVKPWLTAGVALAGGISNAVGLQKIIRKEKATLAELDALRIEDVNSFDRYALRQDLDQKESSEKISDFGMQFGLALPFFLLLDKKIRKDWLDITLMYLETQALSANIYTWSPLGPTFVDRLRPVAYYNALTTEERNINGVKNSFFSGHVSSTATGTFFAAKVYTDYHPELRGKKWLFFSLAALPPVLVGVYRIKALKHYPSDTIVGGIIGTGMGLLIPYLHKRWQRKLRVGMVYEGDVKGVSLGVRF